MRSSKLRTAWFFFNVGLALAGVAVVLFLAHRLVAKVVSYNAATVFVVVIAVLLIPTLAYGLYGAIRIQFYGEPPDSWMERASRLIPRSPKLWFSFLLPMIFFTFASIYQILLTLLVWLVSLPFSGYGQQVTSIISGVVLGLSLFFALGTSIWLWREVRRHLAVKSTNSGSAA